jgi:hypothetical protein
LPSTVAIVEERVDQVPLAVPAVVEFNCTVDPRQISVMVAVSTPALGLGLTYIYTVSEDPVQDCPLTVVTGVTVMVAVTTPAVALTAVKLGMLPLPLPPRPIEVSSLVQL